MGKKAKEHRKKVAKRNEAIAQDRKKAEKAHKEMIMKLIEQENQKGMFNSPVMPFSGLNTPSFGLPLNEGPTLGIPSGPNI